MKPIFAKLKLKEEIDRLDILHWGHFSLIVVGQTYEFSKGLLGFSFVINLVVLVLFYRLFYKTRKNLYYSFWSFSALLGLFLVYKMISLISNSLSFPVPLLYFFSLILLIIELSILYSPIFYPVVNWWEYDFRYRDDLKIKVDETDAPGRLTDLRREAGCLVLFENYKPGDKLVVKDVEGLSGKSFTCEIMSKRQYSLGRPINYGVKFVFSDPKERRDFQELSLLWNSERKLKSFKKLKLNK